MIKENSSLSIENSTVRVGILHSLTGAMAHSESVVKDAVLMAIAEINHSGGVLGKIIEPVIADGASQPNKFITQAQQLTQVQQISTIFGCWTSASRKAILPILEANNAQLWYPLPYEGLENSNNVFYTGSCPNQYLEPALNWLLQGQAQRFYLIGSDYVYTRTVSKVIKAQLKQHGGKLVGEKYLPLGTTDFGDVINKIKQLQPDAVLNTLSGSNNQAFYQQYCQAGISATDIPIVATNVSETELLDIGVEVATGHYACWSYFQAIDTDINKQFVQNFQAKYGKDRVTSDPITSAYAQVYLWKQSVELAQSFEVDKIRVAARQQIFYAPSGWLRLEDNYHIAKSCQIGQILPHGQFQIVFSTDDAIKPLPWLGIEDLNFPASAIITDMLAEVAQEIQHSWQLEQEAIELEAIITKLIKGNKGKGRNQLAPEITRAVMAKLFRANEELRFTQNELLKAEEALKKANEALELRVEERTGQLRLAIKRLEAEITERQRIEEVLRTSEASLQAMFAAMNDLIVVFDRQGLCLKVVSTNNQVLYNYAIRQVSKNLYDFLPPAIADQYLNHIQLALDTKQTISFEHNIEINKQSTWFAANISPMLADTVIWVARDITDRKSAEELLRESQLRLAAIAANVPGVVYRAVLHADDSVSMPYISPRTQEIFGLTPEEFMEHLEWVFDLTHPEDRAQLSEMVKISTKTLTSFEHEYRVPNGGQQPKWVRIISQPHRLDNGDVVWDGVIIDITDRKRTEESLRQAEENYRSIFENAIEGIFQANIDGSYISANPALARIYGYTSVEELLANVVSVKQLYVDQNYHTRLLTALQERSSVIGFESQIYRRDGAIIWISENASVVRDANDHLISYEGIIQDITERKQAEEALQIEQEKSESLLLNILPKSIVEQLKQSSGSIANRFDEVTILFADIVDFSSLSVQVSPTELVNILNQIFSKFDRLAEQYGLEKIKTIGDAYMVVGGLPMHRSDHAEAIADMAIAMQKEIVKFKREDGDPFRLRIGINTGPVIAGVIGIKKFIYDLWGDAVNVASRMESQGLAGGIQVTHATYLLLQEQYVLEERGLIDVKGKGDMTTYLLMGRKIENSSLSPIFSRKH